MTRDEWDAFAYVLDNGFAGSFDDAKAEAYFWLLRDYGVGQVQDAIQQLVRRGSKFIPSAGEIAVVIEETTKPPAFSEVWQRLAPFLTAQDAEIPAAVEKIRDKLGDVVAGWAVTYGIRRLALEPAYDPDIGGAVLHRLASDFDTAMAEPDRRTRLAEIGAGGTVVLADRGLRRVDALGVLGAGPTGYVEAPIEQEVT